ncbi:MAG: bacillithiol biosynthesis cysteine-adding enzyme BshC [Firmicutes bacterium]|nr:bacillithiol biosynthesis cysteine-adding enzyme BshC [Bacillota bacterium]
MTSLRVTYGSARDPRYPLASDYIHAYGRVARLYDYSPHDPAAYLRRAAELEAFPGDRDTLARRLVAYGERLGAPPASLAMAARLADPGAVVVIGGQQPGVLTGPLYTFWKAATILQLAKALRSRLGPSRPVVPVFWIGAEDHDLGEVASLVVQKPGGEIVRLAYDPGPGFPVRTSVGFLPAWPAAEPLLRDLEQTFWPTEFRDRVLDLLRSTARASADLGEWFGRLLLHLFGAEGLVVANPLEPEIRALEAPLLEAAVRESESVSALLAEAAETVTGLGYPPQVEVDPASANLYLYRGTERVLLRRRAVEGAGVRFVAGTGPEERVLTGAELTSLARSSPQSLSTNVVLRPLAQDTVFPVLAYVGGPGEISYFGLFGPVYRHLGRRLPVIYPRPNVTLVEPAVGRHLARSGLSPEQALDLKTLGDARSRYLAEVDPVGIDDLFARLVRSVRQAYAELSPSLARLDPSLSELAAKNLGRVTAEIEWLRGKAWQQHRQNCREAVARYAAIETSFRPLGDYQERVFNIFAFLAKYGPDLAPRLVGTPLVPPDLTVEARHRFVHL